MPATSSDAVFQNHFLNTSQTRTNAFYHVSLPCLEHLLSIFITVLCLCLLYMYMQFSASSSSRNLHSLATDKETWDHGKDINDSKT